MLCGICQPGWRFQGEHCSLCPPASEVEAYSQAKKGGVVFGFCVLAFFGLVYLFLPLFPEQQDALVAEATSVFVSFRAAVRTRREERRRARQKEHSGKHAHHQHALGTARDGPRTNKEVLRRLASASTTNGAGGAAGAGGFEAHAGGFAQPHHHHELLQQHHHQQQLQYHEPPSESLRGDGSLKRKLEASVRGKPVVVVGGSVAEARPKQLPSPCFLRQCPTHVPAPPFESSLCLAPPLAKPPQEVGYVPDDEDWHVADAAHNNPEAAAQEALEANKGIFLRKLKAAGEAGRLIIEQCQIMVRGRRLAMSPCALERSGGRASCRHGRRAET